ncbi:hypothetical protein LCGC14_2916290 [marine sediment metagenome]|uniref:Uncharacterized protein n=2 Tax=root TaxID=1 RepID=A0A0F8XQ75_9ZZZZ|nr:MAG: hypothetical protein LCMAC202_00560 [Marseillevirus LCMAC202]
MLTESQQQRLLQDIKSSIVKKDKSIRILENYEEFRKISDADTTTLDVLFRGDEKKFVREVVRDIVVYLSKIDKSIRYVYGFDFGSCEGYPILSYSVTHQIVDNSKSLAKICDTVFSESLSQI